MNTGSSSSGVTANNNASVAPAASTSAKRRPRTFTFWCIPKPRTSRANTSWKRTFQLQCMEIGDCFLIGCTIFVEKVVYILGPILICFALAIMSGLGHTFFAIILPMLRRYYEQKYPHDEGSKSLQEGSITVPSTIGDWIIAGHILVVCYFLSAIAFNYFMCVTTRNVGKHYEDVVRELAQTQGMEYPESESDKREFQQDMEHKLRIRWQRRREKNTSTNIQRIRRQQLQQARTNAILQRNTQLAKQINTTLQSKQPISANDVAHVVDEENQYRTNQTSQQPQQQPQQQQQHSTTSASSNQTKIQHRRTATKPALQQQNQQQQQRQAKPPSPIQIRTWMVLAPDEWAWCARSKLPKPPRSHYDHVSKALILNLDHYCPWMFNAIGYFNYRYFCTFLWLVESGMMYGVWLSYKPFINSSGPLYRSQLEQFRQTGEWERMHVLSMVPYPHEKMAISLSFMICLAVGIAVACLGGFHLYLVLTAQTTIEFHGNWVSARRAKKEKRKWVNPYSLGMRRNWQQVFGSGGGSQNSFWGKHVMSNPIMAVLVPSCRLPEFLPLPIAGEQGKRPAYRNKKHRTEHEKLLQQQDDEYIV